MVSRLFGFMLHHAIAQVSRIYEERSNLPCHMQVGVISTLTHEVPLVEYIMTNEGDNEEEI